MLAKFAHLFPRLTLKLLCLGPLLLSACLSQNAAGPKRKATAGAATDNSASSVNPGFGRILQDNPIILSKDYNLGADVNLGTLLRLEQDFITNNQQLVSSCGIDSYTVTDCVQVKKNEFSNFIAPVDGRWAFATDTDQFLQVQTFGHIKRSIANHLTNFKYSFNLANPGPSQNYQTALPASAYAYKAFWMGDETLTGYANCGAENNAYFSPATFSLCFGHLLDYPKVFFAHDSSVIYHETGHALSAIMLNMRNTANPSITESSDLGYLFYDEAGAIGEGVADYHSFAMNRRTHFAEWALGRFLGLSRPLTEGDPMHAPGIEETSAGRLAYPTYLNYDPNDPSLVLEDVHFAGQIISHYLVALTRDLQSQCSMHETTAIQAVLALLNESFAEMGDLSAKGNDYTSNKVNLDSTNALTWVRMVTPVNFRRFAQYMAKYLFLAFNQNQNCNGGSYPKDRIESLLDDYGLLLFKTYNQDGNSATTGHSGVHTAVTTANRKKTVLVPKSLLKLDPTQNAAAAFVFDGRADMVAALSNLQSAGQISQITTHIPGDLPYNNGNGRISPGEFLGVALNLYNDSNSPIAGVQVLGNDWDHAKNGAPCNTFADNFPGSSQGAASLTSGEGVPGGCNYITRSNGGEAAEVLAPVCMVEINNSGSTIWALQDQLRSNIALPANECLGGSSSTQDCFIRVVSGADNAYYSKIDPKTTWAKTMNSSGSPTFSYSNIIFFEVNPSTPPGTTFSCRFRARFSNCDDCFTDSANGHDDYLDYEYSGGNPFKIIHFQFTVIN